MTPLAENGPRPPDIRARRAKFFALLADADLDLTDEERHEVATFLLGRRVTTFRDFTADDWGRMLDTITGWFAWCHVRREHGLPAGDSD
jgi:hypothetical protein